METTYKEIFEKNLFPLITNDYILLDLPYFTNVGDVLIWQSTLDLLKDIKYKCIYSSSIETYQKQSLPQEYIIILMGGGNWGDLWIRHHNFRRQILNDYPNNPIIQLPQSVFFKNPTYLQEDINLFSKHKGGITICLRDENSYNFISKTYNNVKTLLLPDLVLTFNINKYTIRQKGKGVLFNKRCDIEAITYTNHNIPLEAIVKDWPTIEKLPLAIKIYNKLIPCIKKIDSYLKTNAYHFITDYLYKKKFKNIIIQSGISFVNKYEIIYSTRLHVAILATLLGKKVYAIDNSYGKIKGVYNLWMKNIGNVKML